MHPVTLFIACVGQVAWLSLALSLRFRRVLCLAISKTPMVFNGATEHRVYLLLHQLDLHSWDQWGSQKSHPTCQIANRAGGCSAATG
ncbi:hypothetical protein GDO81_005962 [Engystomops pustulosus]|uniref:Secreted protein n=1 Tax=Engystomops pustulosus TaxID=76066 RepID=A0AAV7CV38_ENGPU|nr:hypothetical protein GDO81_005962 [Engystomops pustulosus]